MYKKAWKHPWPGRKEHGNCWLRSFRPALGRSNEGGILCRLSEAWLMVNLIDNQKMYFRGDISEPLAFAERVHCYSGIGQSGTHRVEL